MTEDIGKMSLHEWKQQQKYKEEYRKICAAEDRAISDWAKGIEPVKKRKKTNG
jgi:hypothetical protein